MTGAIQLVALIKRDAPELRGVTPTRAQYDRAIRTAEDRASHVSGDPVRLAALVDLIVADLTTTT